MLVVDPANTRTAALADMHLSIRPGSDGLLALAFCKYAIEHADFDPALKKGKGWNPFRRMLKDLSLDDLRRQCDIPMRAFEEAASLLLNNRPGWTSTGLGLELQPGGVQAIRAAACLQSILAPEERPFPLAAGLKPLPETGSYRPMPDPVGAGRWPLFTGRFREGQGMDLHRAILENDPYPVRAMFLAGGNPMLTFPGTRIHQKALGSLDFLAVFDLFMTPTAQLADLIFPAADHLDSHELHDYGSGGKPYVGLAQPLALEAKGRSLWEIVFGIARRLDLEKLFPWQNNREAVAHRLSGTGIDLKSLEKSPSALLCYAPAERTSTGWNTPDGRVQYAVDAARAATRSGLPEPGVMRPPIAPDGEYPLWLSTGDRLAVYHHSQFHGSEKHRKTTPGPFIDIHPRTAKELRVGENDPVLISTRYGRLRVHAKLDGALRRDALRMAHGWEEANVNELTGMEHFDPISGFPWLRALPAKIEKTGP